MHKLLLDWVTGHYKMRVFYEIQASWGQSDFDFFQIGGKLNCQKRLITTGLAKFFMCFYLFQQEFCTPCRLKLNPTEHNNCVHCIQFQKKWQIGDYA